MLQQFLLDRTWINLADVRNAYGVAESVVFDLAITEVIPARVNPDLSDPWGVEVSQDALTRWILLNHEVLDGGLQLLRVPPKRQKSQPRVRAVTKGQLT